MATTTLTIDLPSDVAEKLARKAIQQGQDTAGLLRQLAEREAQTTAMWDAPTMAEWNALLDSFSDGDEQDHQDTVATLAQALNEDRPGQRRVFGAGTNPERDEL